jgi:hypothetical protein
MTEQSKPGIIKAEITIRIEIDPDLADAMKAIMGIVKRAVTDAGVAANVSSKVTKHRTSAAEKAVAMPVQEPPDAGHEAAVERRRSLIELETSGRTRPAGYDDPLHTHAGVPPKRPQRPVVTDPSVANVAPSDIAAILTPVVLMVEPLKEESEMLVIDILDPVAEKPAVQTAACVDPEPATGRPVIKSINDVSLTQKRAIHSYKAIGQTSLSISRQMKIDVEVVRAILAGRFGSEFNLREAVQFNPETGKWVFRDRSKLGKWHCFAHWPKAPKPATQGAIENGRLL